jgi:hypothetical protein
MFRSLFRRQRPTAVRVQPLLESLEDRLVPTTRVVVPVGYPVDNVTDFASLAAALHAVGTQTGDTIQIDAGSEPGNVTLADFAITGVANLTIQGDPNQVLADIPQFTISDQVGLGPGWTFQNVNIGLVDAGSFAFAGCSLIGCTVVNESTTNPFAFSVQIVGSGNVVENTSFVNNANLGVANDTLVEVKEIGSSSANQIIGNTFEAVGPTAGLLAYDNSSGATVTDQVLDNTFIAYLSASVGTENLLSVGSAAGSISGLTIQNNSFVGAQNGPGPLVAIQVNATAQNVLIANNTINLTSTEAGTSGIQITGGTSGTSSTSATIADNNITTTDGAGLYIETGFTASNVVNADVQGNDFNNNVIGVFVLMNSTSTPLGGIDLGGGSQGSLGGNDFRSFTAPATSSSGAIVLAGPTPVAIQLVFANYNIFAPGATSVAYELIGPIYQDQVIVGAPLTGNAAFVQTLYEQLLKRTGNTNSPTDAGSWISYLNSNTMTPTQVVNGIEHAPEALQTLVNGLYLKIMHSPGTTAETAPYLSTLEGGGTVVQVIESMEANALTNAPFNSPAGFVESLYGELLGRVGSDAEIAGWVRQLQTQGSALVVSGIVTSLEFESDMVQQLYGFTVAPSFSVVSLLPPALHRTAAPPASQVNGWASAGLDMLALEADFLSTSEFFSNG